MIFRKFILGLALFIAAVGWSTAAESCCERQMCQNLRALKPHIAWGFEDCCQRPTNELRYSCLQELSTRVNEAHGHILAAKIACDEGDNDLMREHLRRVRDLLLPKIIKNANGQIYNTMVALGRNDWMALDTTLTLAPQDPCKSVTMTVASQGVVNAEATGKAVEEEGASASVAVVVPAASAQSYTTCTYVVPPGTTFDLRFGDEYHGVTIAGAIDLARTNPAIPESGSVVAAIPTDVQLTLSKYGRKARLTLDKTSPYNAMRIDAQGNGVLGVALNLESDSSDLVGLVYVGATIYFEFPVEVNSAWTSVRLNVPRTRPGNELTPAEELTLIAADGPLSPPPPIDSDICGDVNGNGIRDGADRQSYAIDYYLNCTRHQ